MVGLEDFKKNNVPDKKNKLVWVQMLIEIDLDKGTQEIIKSFTFPAKNSIYEKFKKSKKKGNKKIDFKNSIEPQEQNLF